MKLPLLDAEAARKLIRTVVLPAATRTIGRANVVRLSRFINNEVRFDGPNNMHSNGETNVQRQVLEAAKGRCVVFDVGAHIGDWLIAFAEGAAKVGRNDYVAYAFEPCASTRDTLKRRVATARLGSLVHVHGMALSSHAGSGELQIMGEGFGINSLHAPYGERVHNVELVPLETLDGFAARQGLPHVTFVKIDAEGHDREVIKGAADLMAREAVDVIQFEYNWRWIGCRAYLCDVFALLPNGYCLGKVTPQGIEWYPAWNPELETFREANYLLCRKSCRSWFPEVRWWHLDA